MSAHGLLYFMCIRFLAVAIVIEDEKFVNRSVSANENIFNVSNQILYPLVQGCETKDAKVSDLVAYGCLMLNVQ